MSSRARPVDWKAILGLAIGAAALYFTFRSMDLRNVLDELRAADPLLLALTAAAATGVLWFRAWRWRVILAPVGDVPFDARFAATAIGFMGNNIMPARIGEFMRAYALSRSAPVPIVASFSSLVIERIFDGIMVIALLFAAMAMPDFPPFSGSQEIRLPGLDATFTITGLARGFATIIGIALLVVGMLVLFPKRAVAALERVVRILPKSFERPIIDALEAFLSGAGALRNPRLLLGTAAWSLALWLFNAVSSWIAFRAFGMSLPFTAAVFFQSAIAIAVVLPSPPGFVGVYHAMAWFVLATLWGMPTELAGAYAIGLHIVGFIPVTLIGLFYAWRIGMSLGEARESEEIVESTVEAETLAQHTPDDANRSD